MENNPTTSTPDDCAPGDPNASGVNPDQGSDAPAQEDLQGGQLGGVTSGVVLAAMHTLRTPVMWLVSISIIVIAALMILVSPKVGAFTMSALLTTVGTARLVTPGTPFGLSARNRFWDVAFCYGVAAAIVILTNSAHSLR